MTARLAFLAMRPSADPGRPLNPRRPVHETNTLSIRTGGVATSGIDARLWERREGDFAHHLIDPATGTPAWTGLVAATALAPTALEAEALAKAALLSGPAAGRRLLQGRHGGVLVHDDGAVEPVGRQRRSPRLPQVALP